MSDEKGPVELAEEARAAADVLKDQSDKKNLNPDVYEKNKLIEAHEAQRVSEGKPGAASWAEKVANYEAAQK